MNDASSRSRTSLSLLDGLKANDAAAWDRLVLLYEPLVLHWCQQGGIGPADAADVAQEVFRSVMGGIAKFERSGTFRGWLFTIAKNKMMDHHRRRGRQPQAEGGSAAQLRLFELADPDDDDSLDPTGRHPVISLLRRAKQLVRPNFDQRTWSAAMTAIDGEKTSREIGQELGMTANAVRKAKVRVLARLRDALGDMNDSVLRASG